MRTVPTSYTLFFVILLVGTVSLDAQSKSPLASNPRAIEFEIPSGDPSGITGYRIELFPRGADTRSVLPLKVFDVPQTPRANDTRIRIEFEGVLDGLSDGEYIATLRTLSSHGESARSDPTEPFALSGHAGSVRREAAAPRAPPSPASAPQPEPEQEHRPPLAVIIGILMGAAAILVPLIAR